MRMRPGFGPMAEEASLERVGFDRIQGWAHDRHDEALAAFRRSAAVMQAQFNREASRLPRFAGEWSDWQAVCAKAMSAPDARSFFETGFVPFRVKDAARPQGLFTGYYEPLANGRRSRGNGFEVPIYAKPPDLEAFGIETEKALGFRYGRRRDGRPTPYFTRREIEQGALAGQGLEIVWLESWVDAFFIHIQGSGRVLLDDGTSLRLAYAAKSGRPYTAIGGLLVERGEIAREAMSMQAIRQWMASRPEAARQLMWQNESFVFFRAVVIEDESLGAPGAQGVNLTPRRSLAVDREIWPFGMPVWLDLLAPAGPRAELRPLQSLLIAQDTGSAIKGPARGDVYWGWGEAAAMAAGHMASPGSMIVLLPVPLASKIASAP
jgi:membrane-bound lytic murein transglycosylase A